MRAFQRTAYSLLFFFLGGAASFATPITSIWAGGSGNWSNSANWINPPGPPAAGYQVLIDNSNPVSSSVLVDVVTPLLNNVAVDAGDSVTVQQSLSAGTMRSFGGVGVNNGGLVSIGSGGFVQDQSTAATAVNAGGQFLDSGSYSQGNGSTLVNGTLSTSLLHVTGGSVTAGSGGMLSVGSGGYTQDSSVTTTIDSTGQLLVTGNYAQGNGTTIADGTLTAALFHVTGGTVVVGANGQISLGSGGYTQGTAGTSTSIASGGKVTISGGDYSQELGTTTTVDGSITAANVNNSGTLQGTGVINATVKDLGTLSPGDGGVGATTINGAYSQSGFLDADIAGLGVNDFVDISGAATLGGTLFVDLLNGFVPAAGNSFHLMSYASRTGVFNTIDAPALSAGEFWQPVYGTTDFYLTIASGASVPEPASWILTLAGAILAILMALPRRARTSGGVWLRRGR
ncbi:MAG TPA: hypothetical protein VN736_08745 [Candidatus Limnocylindrales bacterium]|nr:hypothetical protein [Candidatus Limnocylindrales bacterium]